MDFEESEQLHQAMIGVGHLTAVATVTGEVADQVDILTVKQCLEVIERLGRECQAQLKALSDEG